MSIQTEVNRIKTAVAAIAQAIRGKGVTVPTTAKVGDLATYISSIKTGADIATCNVTISFGASVGYVRVVATTFENGAIKTFNQSKNSGSFSIQNVVCGSIITIGGNTLDVSYNYELGYIGSAIYLVAPSTTGDYTATIIEYED